MEKQRDEIAIYFNTVRHWNETVRRPYEERIDPDPDGTMMNFLAQMSFILERERLGGA
jgi:hypothetical protein